MLFLKAKTIDSQYIVNCGQTVDHTKPRSKELELNSQQHSKVNCNAIELSMKKRDIANTNARLITATSLGAARMTSDFKVSSARLWGVNRAGYSE